MNPTNDHEQIIAQAVDEKFLEDPKRYHLSVMEVYKSETQEIVRRFLDRQINFADCIAGLDAALAALIPTLKPKQLPDLRAVMLANNERVMKEMHKRERRRKVNAKARADAKSRQASKPAIH